MAEKDHLSALIDIHKQNLELQERHHQEVRKHHLEQNEVNRKTAEALQNLAHQIERSNDRHEVNDARILDAENFIDYAKPIVQRSEWFQSGLSDIAKKYILPLIVLGILATAGYNFMPSDKPQQKQEQSK